MALFMWLLYVHKTLLLDNVACVIYFYDVYMVYNKDAFVMLLFKLCFNFSLKK